MPTGPKRRKRGGKINAQIRKPSDGAGRPDSYDGRANTRGDPPKDQPKEAASGPSRVIAT